MSFLEPFQYPTLAFWCDFLCRRSLGGARVVQVVGIAKKRIIAVPIMVIGSVFVPVSIIIFAVDESHFSACKHANLFLSVSFATFWHMDFGRWVGYRSCFRRMGSCDSLVFHGYFINWNE